MVNESILQQKIQSLLQYPILNKQSVKTVADILKTQDDWSLFRINPLHFANQHGLNEHECLDIFVHGTKIGLFDLSYEMVCPACYGIVHNHHALAELEKDSFYCALCHINTPTTLDEQVEVSFTLHPSVKELDINPLSDFKHFHRYYFSGNTQKSEQVLDFCWEKVIKELLILEPDERHTLSLEVVSNQSYQVVSVENNSYVVFNFAQSNQEQPNRIEIDLLPTAFTPSQVQMPLGSCEIHIKNHTNSRLGCLIMKLDERKDAQELIKQYPPIVIPVFTPKMLLNNQSFRDLFRVQPLSETFNVNVKNLTIMFTDLRGSTEMYDKAGDVFAYKLVKTHFQILTDTVRHYSGAIVKTMGDAIMATFSRPLDGFLASLEMLKQIEEMNESWKASGYEIGLKVGLNEGPALAVVNDERIDYFGQSVNIAARVQGLAQAGEIWMTQSILDSPGVLEKLSRSDYQSEQRSATLKGVEQTTVVHKVFK
ncbi:MAG: adenylate/guanylate cyclase domain-containing protein [Candidatus Parabeggiatoa sp. nov. 3]|nr:MAG: adenylate/guanylate cyclase domain-containing protein [Gammaproteobacteria bacterium]RKZ88778.1 MAG: adenylate/guanylate cyclase domain-containing protein [Gammaproteobacteria bacterium]